MFLRRLPFLFGLLGALSASSVFAHDPLEVTTDMRVRTDAITIVATMARSTAWRICSEGKSDGRVFAPEQFETLRKLFIERGRSLFEITSAGKTLSPREGDVTVVLTVENDVEFHLVFPTATAAAAPLRIRAPFLKTLPPDGYGAMLTAYGAKGALLGQQLLTLEEPMCELAPP